MVAEITTERLILRRWTSADASALAAIHDNAEVMEWLGSGPLSREQSDVYLHKCDAHFAEHGFGFWAVERRSDGALIGVAGLRKVLWPDHPMTPCVEIGWRQARWAWGNGYIAEAARAALEDGFQRIGVEEVFAWTAAANTRSQAVMERIGMARHPARDFTAPALPPDHPLSRHVVYRIALEIAPAVAK